MITESEHLQPQFDRFLAIKQQPFSVSGTFPMPQPMNMFFQTAIGISHVMTFPIEPELASVPSFDAFHATCVQEKQPTRPMGSPSYDMQERDRHSLTFPSYLPVALSLDLCSHPILDAVQSVLFPNHQMGHHIVAVRDKVELYAPGSYSRVVFDPLQPRVDALVATIVVVLPVRFRGGAMIIRRNGLEERFTPQAKAGELEWTAFRSDCDQEVQRVESGYRMQVTWNVLLKTFGPGGLTPNPLIAPNPRLTDALVDILKRARGLRLGFYLSLDYGICPGDVLADSLVPRLKGADAVLYHAVKLYKLDPELRYVAGGYIWPVDQPAEIPPFDEALSDELGYLAAHPVGNNEDEDLSIMIEHGGGVRIEQEDIVIVGGPEQGYISRERVPFLPARENALDYLNVNVLLVVYVP
ncbi:hypothetical protein BOTBODRAFT_121049 [Botryobasidium botryosum FD-172 SS1]|uniref:Uncharacterized protein n=1 Tax=Botryobasidium botryosum (strain FD-172 SS1) TaxID=930990 RepID=A0A067LUG8_BOTB1|nr:hypothetical protein BOTBODRAFT_121049 [Botryobasidium botryosum FD-172 SS1]